MYPNTQYFRRKILFNAGKSKKLALLAAMALVGGGAFVQSAYAADVTIDSAHPPLRNVPNPDDPAKPNSAASVGDGAENASGNTLTVNAYKEDSLSVFGGVARGTGDAADNTVRIKGSATEIASIYGGAAWGTGSAKGNKVYFDAGTVSFAEWMVGGYVGRSGNAENNIIEVNGGKTSALYGGFSNRSDATGQIRGNHVVIHRGTIDGKVYGGAFGGARAAGDVTHNTVTITGGTVKRTVCGGALEKNDATGNVTHNEVTVAGGTLRQDIIGGYTRRGGHLTGNIVTITGGEIQGNVYAAMSAGNTSTIRDNVVNLGDGKNELAAGTEIAKYIFGASGGNRASYAGNTLNVKASARAKNIVGFNKVNFYFTDTLQPKLSLRDSTGTKLGSLRDITVYGSPTAPSGTLIENRSSSGGITIRDGVNTLTRTGDTAETTLSKSSDNKKINYTRLIFKGARAAETEGADTWGGRSKVGNTTTENEITVASGAHTNIYGGWTSGSGSDAPAERQRDSRANKVTVSGTATVSGTVYGGFTDVAGGAASGNEVTIAKDLSAHIVGGHGTVTNNNMIRLYGAHIAGTVTGGTAANGTGNTLAIYRPSAVQDFAGVQNIDFYTDEMPAGGTTPLLRLGTATKDIRGLNIGVVRSGAAPKLSAGDRLLLMQTSGGALTTDAHIVNRIDAMQGVSRIYDFAIAQTATGALTATVMGEEIAPQTKSIVETRTGASAFLSDGADLLAGTGMDAAKKAAANAAAQPGSVPYGLWAGMGGGALRHNTGSYVEMRGWNLGVGWARENTVRTGTLIYGPFIEYGRGTYDSYLDDGTHGSGRTSYLGAGLTAALDTKNHWLDASLHAGRTRSDYTGITHYDSASTYYALHIGMGRDFRLNGSTALNAYLRYFYTHTTGTHAVMDSGEHYDCAAVDSHRLRIGARYTYTASLMSQIYAGLAWEHEFDGTARATYDGDGTPAPSLRGGSALLELGCSIAPQNSPVRYDLRLTGWQGKREGLTGGISVRWTY